MATIGRRAAVAQFPKGRLIRGTLGWLSWLGLHVVYLIGFRNKVTVLVNWSWRYLSWASGPRIIVGEDLRGPPRSGGRRRGRPRRRRGRHRLTPARSGPGRDHRATMGGQGDRTGSQGSPMEDTAGSDGGPR